MRNAVNTHVSVLAVQYALLFTKLVCNMVLHYRVGTEVVEMGMEVVEADMEAVVV